MPEPSQPSTSEIADSSKEQTDTFPSSPSSTQSTADGIDLGESGIPCLCSSGWTTSKPQHQFSAHDGKPKDYLFDAAKQAVLEKCPHAETFIVNGVERTGRIVLDDDSAASETTSRQAKVKKKRGDKIREAMTLLALHPEWTQKKIAEKVGCSQSNLSMSPQFVAARKAIRRSGRQSHSATRNARTGEIEFSCED